MSKYRRNYPVSPEEHRRQKKKQLIKALCAVVLFFGFFWFCKSQLGVENILRIVNESQGQAKADHGAKDSRQSLHARRVEKDLEKQQPSVAVGTEDRCIAGDLIRKTPDGAFVQITGPEAKKACSRRKK